MSTSLKILILGGYGTFGGRTVQLLQSNPALTLIVAGRSLAKAKAFCQSRPNASAKLTPAAFDRNGDTKAQINQHRPDLLIDASGPFQAYGEDRYRVIEACIAARVNYLDLADGADFVAGVKTLDAAAKSAGIFALSGASSFPLLTAAVVRRLSRPMARVESLRAGISPSPRAGVGENVIRAIASYAGQQVSLRRGGKTVIAHPLTETMRYTIAPPGRIPLRNALFSLVDVPDLKVLADLWPQTQDIWMGAGPVPEVLHRLLIALSWLVRLKLVPTLAPLAPLMHWATNHLRWGEPRGGMFVEVIGGGQTRSWHLLAEGDDGPLIPSMAVASLVERVLAGQAPAPGARVAVSDLELEDYEAQFARRAIFTGIRDDAPQDLFPRLLGSAYSVLPPALQALHRAPAAFGAAEVDRGQSAMAKVVAKLLGFPKATVKTPVRVSFTRKAGREIWRRKFGNESFASELSPGAGRADRLLVEKFGPLAFAMALVVEDAALSFVLRRWTVFGFPLPLRLAPRVQAVERAVEGVFHVTVEIAHPFTGLIVRYRVWLAPEIDARPA